MSGSQFEGSKNDGFEGYYSIRLFRQIGLYFDFEAFILLGLVPG
jgi:plasmid maintenance system killer protein